MCGYFSISRRGRPLQGLLGKIGSTSEGLAHSKDESAEEGALKCADGTLDLKRRHKSFSQSVGFASDTSRIESKHRKSKQPHSIIPAAVTFPPVSQSELTEQRQIFEELSKNSISDSIQDVMASFKGCHYK